MTRRRVSIMVEEEFKFFGAPDDDNKEVLNSVRFPKMRLVFVNYYFTKPVRPGCPNTYVV